MPESVADCDDVDAAWGAYELLKSVEDGRHLEIESVVVVKRDSDGRLEVHKSTDHRMGRGLAWGVVGGIVLGVIFPPSIIGSAIVLGAAGAATGKLTELHHKKEIADQCEDAIAAGHCGIIALVSDPGVIDIRKALAKAAETASGQPERAPAQPLATTQWECAEPAYACPASATAP